MQIRQMRIRLEQQTRSVGQGDLRKIRPRRVRRCGRNRRRRRLDRVQRNRREPRRLQVSFQHALQVRRRHRAQALEIRATVIQVADDDFRRPEPRSLPAHRFTRIDFADDDLPHRLAQLRRRKTFHRAPRQCRGNRARSGDAFRRIRREADTKKSARPRIPTRGVDRVHQSGFFADFLPQHRAIATAENRGEQVEHGRIRVREPRNRPRQRTTRELDVFVAMQCSRRELPRLLWHEHGRQTHARGRPKMLFHRRPRRG